MKVVLVLTFLLPFVVQAAFYRHFESYIGHDFLNPEKFTYFTDPDPTHGRVTYVNATVAKDDNLTFASPNTFIARADYITTLTPDGPGRNSVRMFSKEYYNTSVVVVDLKHMPQGCGTWPAIWTLGDDWPSNGEIDIVEDYALGKQGVNNQAYNQATLHTNPNCTMPDTGRAQTGEIIFDNCDVNANFNQGCGVAFDNRTFGPSFNDAGGGWFAMERTIHFIKVWSWPRSSWTVPLAVRYGSSDLDTLLWGTPQAYFPRTSSCDLPSKMGPQQIVFDLTLCGDWAGQDNVYAASGCPSSCIDYVNSNPMAFKDAYFEFNSIRVYTSPKSNHRRVTASFP